MKFKSAIVTQASGSVGGTTFARNRGGMYMRARAVPTNPNSPQQQAVRGALSQNVSTWGDVLTDAQRDGWDTYALNTPKIDSLGEPVNMGGLGAYNRCNVLRVVAGLARVDTPPTFFNFGAFTDPVVGVVDASASTLSLAFANTDDWANEDGSSMCVFISRGQNASRNYFKGPYRYAGRINGNATTAPTSPATITVPFALTAGQRVFVRVVVTRADGRVSSDFLGNAVVTA